MISDIVQAIANTVHSNFTDAYIYQDNVPNNFKKPAFVIYTNDIESNRKINDCFENTISFDLCYFSDSNRVDKLYDIESIRDFVSHMHIVSDGVETYRLLNKRNSVVDSVLHYTFDIKYKDMKVNAFNPMQNVKQNINEKSD